MRKTAEQIAKETRAKRLELHKRVHTGESEQAALIAVFPKDGNRTRTLKRWKQAGLWPIPVSELSEVSEQSETVELSELSNISEHPEPSDAPLPEHWRESIRDLIREELQSMIDAQTLPKFQTTGVQWPPIPPEITNLATKRKKAAGAREKLGVIIDKALHEAFDGWARRHNVSYSFGLETILWLYFGKPPLSFESEESENPEDTED